MQNVPVPAGYQSVMPYLILPNALNFFTYTQKVFGATEKSKVMHNETIVMHGEVQIGVSTIMFASSTAQWTTQAAGMFVYVADADETYEKAIAEGGTSVTKMSDQPYGRTGGVKDPFGNTWWITSVKQGNN